LEKFCISKHTNLKLFRNFYFLYLNNPIRILVKSGFFKNNELD
jgi:hypothetical protein